MDEQATSVLLIDAYLVPGTLTLYDIVLRHTSDMTSAWCYVIEYSFDFIL
jgi:hypothetical protein